MAGGGRMCACLDVHIPRQRDALSPSTARRWASDRIRRRPPTQLNDWCRPDRWCDDPGRIHPLPRSGSERFHRDQMSQTGLGTGDFDWSLRVFGSTPVRQRNARCQRLDAIGRGKTQRSRSMVESDSQAETARQVPPSPGGEAIDCGGRRSGCACRGSTTIHSRKRMVKPDHPLLAETFYP